MSLSPSARASGIVRPRSLSIVVKATSVGANTVLTNAGSGIASSTFDATRDRSVNPACCAASWNVVLHSTLGATVVGWDAIGEVACGVAAASEGSGIVHTVVVFWGPSAGAGVGGVGDSTVSDGGDGGPHGRSSGMVTFSTSDSFPVDAGTSTVFVKYICELHAWTGLYVSATCPLTADPK